MDARVDLEGAVAATFEREPEAGCAGRARIEGMRAARASGDAPAAGGRGGGRTRGMGDEQRRRPAGLGGEAQAARGNAADLVEEAEDESRGAGAQALLDRPQDIVRPARLDQDQRPRIEPQAMQPRAVRAPGLSRHVLGRAPQNADRRGPAGVDSGTLSNAGVAGGAHAPHCKSQRKAEGGAPINGTRSWLQLVDAARIEPFGTEAGVEIHSAEPPGLRLSFRRTIALQPVVISRACATHGARLGYAPGSLNGTNLRLEVVDDVACPGILGRSARRNGEGQLTVPAWTGPCPFVWGW